jgi:hypothetical protein
MCKDGRAEHARLESAGSPVRWCGVTAEPSVWKAYGDLRVLEAYVGMCSHVFLLCVRTSRKGDTSSHRGDPTPDKVIKERRPTTRNERKLSGRKIQYLSTANRLIGQQAENKVDKKSHQPRFSLPQDFQTLQQKTFTSANGHPPRRMALSSSRLKCFSFLHPTGRLVNQIFNVHMQTIATLR